MFDIRIKMDEGFRGVDFDRKKIRKAMRTVGRDVQKEARRLVARRALSGAGDYPGRVTGRLWRSIKPRVSRSGFMVKVQPEKLDDMKAFYPAFLNYGVTGKPARKDRKTQEKDGQWRIAPRRNYMTDALESRRDVARAAIRNALRDALAPRK